MPDGPRYDDDFYAWTQYQAEVLRSLQTTDNRFDREHLAEEVEDLGKSERDALRSQVRRILVHFLKLQYSPASMPRLGWKRSIIQARATIDDKLSASLRRDLDARLPKLFADAKKEAAVDLEEYGEHETARSLPVTCPYTIDQVLTEDWYPEPAVGTAAGDET